MALGDGAAGRFLLAAHYNALYALVLALLQNRQRNKTTTRKLVGLGHEEAVDEARSCPRLSTFLMINCREDARHAALAAPFRSGGQLAPGAQLNEGFGKAASMCNYGVNQVTQRSRVRFTGRRDSSQ